MVKINPQKNKKLYPCRECGFQYADREWAEKCETWCKEHHSCNLEITAHGSPPETAEKQISVDAAARMTNQSSAVKQILKSPFYWLVAIDGALGLGLLYWWLLSKVTTWVTFYSMYANVPLYFWPYVILTLASIILFGMNLAVAVYTWERVKGKSLKTHGSTALGAGLGALAAACPICGAFLLSLLGLTSGLAVFPFKGLELKLLSATLFAVSLIFSVKKLSDSAVCENCELNPNKTTLAYQTPAAILFIILLLAAPLWQQELTAAGISAKNGTLLTNKINLAQKTNNSNLYNEVVVQVLPQEGFQTKIIFGDTIIKLVENGVIDPEKFKQLYKERGVNSQEATAYLDRASYEPIKINSNNAGLLVNLLWPVGLSNKTEFNKKSQLNGGSLFNFASTGGWTIGKKGNGGEYFNKYEIVKLTPAQEEIVLEVAQNTYRPCCGNSTFFQDCNHGSALLGLIELGASQGMSKEELYKVALQFNSFWFPQTYVQTALYYKIAKNIDWKNVNPAEIMGFDYSSAPGWTKNISRPFQELTRQNPDLLPQTQGGSGCGV